MASYPIGACFSITVPVIDKGTGNLVDPATFLFTMLSSTGASNTYSWNGTTWTTSESAIAVPSHTGLGTFVLRITVPHLNTAQGGWAVDWKHTANGGGFGEGGNNTTFTVTPSPALP